METRIDIEGERQIVLHAARSLTKAEVPVFLAWFQRSPNHENFPPGRTVEVDFQHYSADQLDDMLDGLQTLYGREGRF